LFARPRKNRMGRPRIKGERLPSPEARARSAAGWTSLEVEVYGGVALGDQRAAPIARHAGAGLQREEWTPTERPGFSSGAGGTPTASLSLA
jgi:hypothetical protein